MTQVSQLCLQKLFLQVVAAWGKSFPLELSWGPWKGCQQINASSRPLVTSCTSPKLSATKVLLSPSPLLNLHRNLGVSQFPGARTFHSGCGNLFRHCLCELRGRAVLFVGLAQHLPSPSGGYSLCIKDEEAVKTLAQHLALACRFWPILPLISVISKRVVCSQCSSQVEGTSGEKWNEGGWRWFWELLVCCLSSFAAPGLSESTGRDAFSTTLTSGWV